MLNVQQATVNATFEVAEPSMDGNDPNVRHYYSTYWGNVMIFNFDDNGDETTNKSKISRIVSVTFSNPGNPSFTKQAAKNGHFATADPAIIKALEKHRTKQINAGQRPDILTPEEFQMAVLPAEDAIALMREKLAVTEKEKLVLQNQLAAAVNQGQGVGQAGRK